VVGQRPDGGNRDYERPPVPARVVVVDDDEALRNAVRRALRLEGYDVELAVDGAEASIISPARARISSCLMC
jgi:CheY-like chemotaxis protein